MIFRTTPKIRVVALIIHFEKKTQIKSVLTQGDPWRQIDSQKASQMLQIQAIDGETRHSQVFRGVFRKGPWCSPSHQDESWEWLDGKSPSYTFPFVVYTKENIHFLFEAQARHRVQLLFMVTPSFFSVLKAQEASHEQCEKSIGPWLEVLIHLFVMLEKPI